MKRMHILMTLTLIVAVALAGCGRRGEPPSHQEHQEASLVAGSAPYRRGAALLSTLAGIALGFISLGFVYRTFERPIVGLATLAIDDWPVEMEEWMVCLKSRAALHVIHSFFTLDPGAAKVKP